MPTRRAPGTRRARFSAWYAPIVPAPITPTASGDSGTGGWARSARAFGSATQLTTLAAWRGACRAMVGRTLMPDGRDAGLGRAGAPPAGPGHSVGRGWHRAAIRPRAVRTMRAMGRSQRGG